MDKKKLSCPEIYFIAVETKWKYIFPVHWTVSTIILFYSILNSKGHIHSHNSGCAFRGNLGFGILPKATSIHWLQGSGIEAPILWSKGRPSTSWVLNAQSFFWQLQRREDIYWFPSISMIALNSPLPSQQGNFNWMHPRTTIIQVNLSCDINAISTEVKLMNKQLPNFLPLFF